MHKEDLMIRLVSNDVQAQANIRRFGAEVAGDEGMKSRLAYNRAWYAEAKPNGGWDLGPSKFIGYEGMTAKAYDPQNLNGRETEKQLANWYTQIQPTDPLFPEIDRALRDFLAQYGKAPSALYRINISNQQFAEMTGDHSAMDDETLVSLLIAVARRLPSAGRARVRAAL